MKLWFFSGTVLNYFVFEVNYGDMKLRKYAEIHLLPRRLGHHLTLTVVVRVEYNQSQNCLIFINYENKNIDN